MSELSAHSLAERHNKEHAPHDHQFYRYLKVGSRILDREHIVTLIDHRTRLLAPGIEVVFSHERLASFLVQDQADQELLLHWYLHAPPQAPRPFLQLGAHLLSRACICEVVESSIASENTILLRYVSLPDPLMGNAESSIQTLELHGQTADAVRHWLSSQTEILVPLKRVASTPPTIPDFLQKSPTCPHCESWLTPLWDDTQRTPTLVCLLCHSADGPFTRGDKGQSASAHPSKKG
jgi:hypothetical protein